MEALLWRARVSFLWVALAVGMLGASMLEMVTPGNTLTQGEMEGGPITNEMLFFISLFFLVPLVMSVLTLALKDVAARWANGVMAVVAAVMWLWDIAESVSGGGEFTAGMLSTAIMVVFAALIAWHAWQWPVSTESPA